MRKILTLATVAAMLAVGCGDDEPDASGAGAGDDRVSVVVTTNILGDVVGSIVGEAADVEVIMPLGADPHDFAPSARQAAAMEEADLLVVNGAGFEEGMLAVIDSVADTGTPVFAFADVVPLLTGVEHGHDEHGDETHAEETHGDETHAEETHGDETHAEETHAEETHGDETHAEETHGDETHGEENGFDPHLWTDPARIAAAVSELSGVLAALDGIDTAALAEQTADYVAALETLDAEIEAMLDGIPGERRVLVTNHEVFGYFADRYDFDVIGAVVPSLTTNAETSARELEQLAALIAAQDVPAIFAETTQSAELAEALAAEAGGDVAIVELFAESLGPEGSGAETYIGMMRTNAQRLADTLGAA
jgi:zinc/manganese transport system substrate-binding protein